MNRGWQPGTPKTRVDVLDLDLHQVDPESGAERCVGVLFVVAIPRQALSAETLQATIRAHHGAEISVEQLLEAQFVSPIAASQLWSMGEGSHGVRAPHGFPERIKAFTAWLEADEEDDDDAPSL